MVAFRKNPYVKRYWKYSLILLPAVFLIIIRLVNKRKDNAGSSQSTNQNLSGTIEKIKDDLQETHLETAVEVSAARAKSAEKIRELKKVKEIPDQKERLRRLADMIG
jgi:predicted  nucleic acid-binding Zn-ribbon protein